MVNKAWVVRMRLNGEGRERGGTEVFALGVVDALKGWEVQHSVLGALRW